MIDENKILRKNSTKNLKLLGTFEKENNFKYPNKKEYVENYAKYIHSKYNFIPINQIENLIKNYGIRTIEILEICKENKEYLQLVHEDYNQIKGEIIYQIRKELAQNPLDVLLRRTRLGFFDNNVAENSLFEINRMFAKELNWSKKKEIEEYSKNKSEFKKLKF